MTLGMASLAASTLTAPDELLAVDGGPQLFTPPAAASAMSGGLRTVFGLDPVQLHSRYWAALGVQVVRQGEPSEIVKHAELFLLTDPRSLPLFKLQPLMDALMWMKPLVLFVRLHDQRQRSYRERVVTGDDDRFRRFERIYDSPGRLARVVLTPEREIAQLWQRVPDPQTGWRRLRRFMPRLDRLTLSVDGKVYDRTSDGEVAAFLHDLVRDWKRPDSTINRARRDGEGDAGQASQVWADPAAKVADDARLIGPVWVGAGREVKAGESVVGPAILWDAPDARPAGGDIQWLTIEPTEPPADPTPKEITPLDRAFKRGFDIVFSLFAILMTLPLYPFVALALWLEDGLPIFYRARRETIGGREFGCLKFRSMVNNSDELTKKLLAEGKNRGDGGRIFIDPDHDPRLLKVGRFLRKYNLDELPQFWNVLFGDMSVVGPRPSPRKENQFCPAWREARLSVRPGITGLWQTRRTRRAGQDFQEWIKYDIEYVETMSPWLDLKIIWRTVSQIVRKGTHQ
jgi:lipopolysaccharide/colanic/teichoic acid biosynthesis glycosyltransferase